MVFTNIHYYLHRPTYKIKHNKTSVIFKCIVYYF